jgi:hypothetical protein
LQKKTKKKKLIKKREKKTIIKKSKTKRRLYDLPLCFSPQEAPSSSEEAKFVFCSR